MATLYLIRFNHTDGTHEILDSTTAICKGIPQNFELLSVTKAPTHHTVYSISYSNTLFSCKIVNNKFIDLQTTVVNPADAYHGVLSLTDKEVLVTNMRRPTITHINLVTHKKTDLPCAGGCRLKDVAALGPSHLLVVSSENGPITGTSTASGGVSPIAAPYDSHILIYERGTNRLVLRHTLPRSQVDCCIYRAPFCFVSHTDMHGKGSILRGRVTADFKITDITLIPCAGFPHGLAIHGELFAYTSYGESALYIQKITEDGEITD
jgi:hypothetical protein